MAVTTLDVCLVVLLSLLPGTLQTPEPAAPMRELADQSTIVFVGTCSSTRSRWDESRRMITTDSTFRIESYLKGAAGRTVTVTEPGGVLHDRNLAMMVPGIPQFLQGEQVVLFVRGNPTSGFQVVGQGKYTVTRDPASGARMVERQPLARFLDEVRRSIAEPMTDKARPR